MTRLLLVMGSILLSLVTQMAIAADIEITKMIQLPCFVADERMGYLPKPNCEVKARSTWGEEVTYKFNSLGIRDKEIEDRTSPEQIRVLLIGPGIDGVGLSSEETPAALLQQKLQGIGIKTVQVINGTVPGFFAPRYSMIASLWAEKIKPDVVVYNQSGEYFVFDLIEDMHVLYNEFSEKEKYQFPYSERTVTGVDYLDRWIEAWSRMKLFWSIYWKSPDRISERKKLVDSTVRAHLEMRARFGLQTKYLIAWSPRPATNIDVFSNLNTGLDFLLRYMVPELRFPGIPLTREMNRTGARLMPMANDFAQALKNGLVQHENLFALTKSGADLWAESVARELVSVLSIEVPEESMMSARRRMVWKGAKPKTKSSESTSE